MASISSKYGLPKKLHNWAHSSYAPARIAGTAQFLEVLTQIRTECDSCNRWVAGLRDGEASCDDGLTGDGQSLRNQVPAVAQTVPTGKQGCIFLFAPLAGSGESRTRLVRSCFGTLVVVTSARRNSGHSIPCDWLLRDCTTKLIIFCVRPPNKLFSEMEGSDPAPQTGSDDPPAYIAGYLYPRGTLCESNVRGHLKRGAFHAGTRIYRDRQPLSVARLLLCFTRF